MKTVLLIARRELGSYLRSPLGYVLASAILLIDGLWFYAFGLGPSTSARLSSDVLAKFFEGATGTTMIASVILAMRLLAGEREHGTMVLLNTAPIRDAQIVLGKFTAAFLFILGMTAFTVYMPSLIFVHGRVSVGHILVGYSGVLLLGAAALALGMFASSLAKNQVVAVVLSGALLGSALLLWMVAKVTEPPINGFISGLALHHERQKPFMAGVLRLENVVYYAAVTLFGLFAATKVLEARRWR